MCKCGLRKQEPPSAAEIGTRTRVRQWHRSVRRTTLTYKTAKWNKHTNRIKWMWQHVIMIYIYYFFFSCVCLPGIASRRLRGFLQVSGRRHATPRAACVQLFRVYRCLCANSAAAAPAAASRWHFISDFHFSSLLCAHSHRSPRFDAMKHESRTRKIGVKDEEEEDGEVFKWMTVLCRRRLCHRWFIREKREKKRTLDFNSKDISDPVAFALHFRIAQAHSNECCI